MSDTKVDTLAGYMRYLRDCIADGNIDPRTLDEWVRDSYGCSWAELGKP